MTAAFVVSATARRAFDRMAADLKRVFGDRFVALVASGPTSSFAFATSLTADDLEAVGALTETWHHDGLDTPLLLTPEQFRRSLDAFPLEYQTVIEHHVVIAGHPPFAEAVVQTEHLRRACEVQAKSHLLHLRQGWVEAVGHDDALAHVIVRSAAPLRALLANVARLHGHSRGEDNVAMSGARLAGLSPDLVSEVLAVESAPDRARQLVRRLPEYLAAAERLWAFVDGWDG